MCAHLFVKLMLCSPFIPPSEGLGLGERYERFPSPSRLVPTPCGHVDVNLKRGGGMFARHSRRAVAVNYLLAGSAVAQHGVRVALRSRHLILAEFDHADFRVQPLSILDCLRDLLSVSQDEHFGLAFRV